MEPRFTFQSTVSDQHLIKALGVKYLSMIHCKVYNNMQLKWEEFFSGQL